MIEQVLTSAKILAGASNRGAELCIRAISRDVQTNRPGFEAIAIAGRDDRLARGFGSTPDEALLKLHDALRLQLSVLKDQIEAIRRG